MFQSILIANRGEIAIRIARAANAMGIRAVMMHSADDAQSLHVRAGDAAVPLAGAGPRAYLDIDQIISQAAQAGCDAIHPGYGFLSENAGFARACATRGIAFVGPSPAALEIFGDKASARDLAKRCNIPTLSGTDRATSVEDAKHFFSTLGEGGSMIIKAIAGGGGRGMRVVDHPDQIDKAYAQCRAEAEGAFGNDALYVERFIADARHIEVQIVGERSGKLMHLWDRECSVQRRNQKLVEIAPAPNLSMDVRQAMLDAAVTLGNAAQYDSLGTIEFLVDVSRLSSASTPDQVFAFIEANPRLQVEHTVTEEVCGLDLVELQIGLAAGMNLSDMGLQTTPESRGYTIQVRVNAETHEADNSVKPSGGTLTTYEPPSGPGIRVDGFGYAGYRMNPVFDSLLAKVIARGPSLQAAATRAERAIGEFRVTGVATSIVLLGAVLRHPDFVAGHVTTRFVERNITILLSRSLDYGRHFNIQTATPDGPEICRADEGMIGVRSSLNGMLMLVEVALGDPVRAGQSVAIVEALKMQHAIKAPEDGIVETVNAAPGDQVAEGALILQLSPANFEDAIDAGATGVNVDEIRPDLEEMRARHRFGLDEARPEAVAKRRKISARTARENVANTCDPESFIEYGALTVAAQRGQHSVEELMQTTTGDGLIAGLGSVNGAYFDEAKSRCAVMAYDYTVVAGTQSYFNHKKACRILEIARERSIPVIWWTEGGGGRPGEVDIAHVRPTGLNIDTGIFYARLSGLVPRIAVNHGRCFAGNAVMFGASDITIATRNSSIGMGGPAMIEVAGMGTVSPDDVGPIDIMSANGVVDVVVEDEIEAAQVARQAMSYFQGPLSQWRCADQRLLRHAIPDQRMRGYDPRRMIETIADEGSFLELRRQFGRGMITAFVRIEGRPFGLICNDCAYQSGVIDNEGSDKAARFFQLCDAFDIPILSLIDTPGFMVGIESEKSAAARHGVRMMTVGSNITVPIFAIVVRRCYGFGGTAMAGGGTSRPFFIISWPSGEFGGMAPQGAVQLGYRRQLDATSDPAARKALNDALVEDYYERGKAVTAAQYLDVDAVIDPAETRHWIIRGLKACPPPLPRNGKKLPFIDNW